MDLAILIAALVAASASIYAAGRSARTARELQRREQEFQSAESKNAHCRELQSRFLDELRGAGADLETETSAHASGHDKALSSLIGVSSNCHKRAKAAADVAAQLRIFCHGRVSAAADAAVTALSNYGFGILYYVSMVIDDGDEAKGAAHMQETADEYAASVEAFESAVRETST